MPKNASEIEGRLSSALCAYRDRGGPKIAPLAREFRVSYQQLKGRVHGRQSRSARPGPNKALDKAQEQALISWVKILSDANAPATAQEIEGCANDILSRGGSNRRVNKNWAYDFIKRLPNDYDLITQRTMEAERIDAERLPVITEWFHKLEGTLKLYKLGPRNIYNIDETGFQIGQGKSQRVVTNHKNPKKVISTGGIAETVTGVECIAADGWVMPPMILLAGSVHLEDWYCNQPNLPGNYSIGTSPTGWNNEVSP